ncbi:MAG: Sporulation associated-membrane protein [Parcubacteria group bacterium GW2011_GWB1_41_6]|nr:MAG: Sporulation associated-membrane protein [Parcubacteria group bacterium GW2011_GWB1_41_6]KKS33564.1 MAG: Sporulation associated-membrane protein [Parcubacteria group bacterium GW2011_GWC2_42_13]KKS57855.1 MAG: Sporulation associated-membrane protein [Parcubacteria group bacterium GW2011_GWA2_42_35]KKS71292.1 MAG: Sporulation associated-membrane protein [Parcubacteria group bacterium GW2011_GWF2_42_7]
MLSSFYHLALVKPLWNALIFLTAVLPLHDVGLSIVVLTLAVRFVIFPFTHRSVKTQVKMKELEPEIQKIKEKHKNKPEQTKKIMELYRQHGVSPFSGCLVLLIQLPILLALYKLFWGGVQFDSAELYSFVKMPEIVQLKFLGLVDINQKNIFLALLTGVTQFFQMRLSFPPSGKKAEPVKIKPAASSFKDDLSRSMSFQSKYILPGIIFLVALRSPAAVAVYWTTMNLFGIVHESVVRGKAKKLFYGRDNGQKNNQPERVGGSDKKNR